MSTSDPTNSTARRYLGELDRALLTAPEGLRADILADISDQLRGLNESETNARIVELGDPRVIAADAMAEARSSEGASTSKAYADITAIVLVVGWYLIPVLGWVVGLIMIGVGDRWSAFVKRKAILTSLVGALLSGATLMVGRATEFWPVGLIVVLVVPLITNIFVASYLRRHWN